MTAIASSGGSRHSMRSVVTHAPRCVPLLSLLSLLILAMTVTTSTAMSHTKGLPWLASDDDVTGVPEATCSVQDVEQANDSQLYTILQELKQTHFFRHFVVDLDESCPLAEWNGKKKAQNQKKKEEQEDEQATSLPNANRVSPNPMATSTTTTTTTTTTVSTSTTDDSETVECASEGLPDMDDDAGPACGLKEESPFGMNQGQSQSFAMSQPKDEPKDQTTTETIECASEGLPDMDDDAGPACGLQEEDPFSAFGSNGGLGQSTAPPLGEPQSTTKNSDKPQGEESMTTATITDDTDSKDDEDENESEFECDGGEDLDMDEDAEPLCRLTEDDYLPSSPISKFISMALETIRYLGFESESQKEAYQWQEQTHKVVEDSSSSTVAADCELSENDLFWQDICSHISNNDGHNKVVNLVLNPERNTAYNGTHIWNAIYEENCVHGEKDDLCYEERVLYRLLSGLHSSTTLSIAKHYYPPSKRKKRVNWESNPSYFMEKFEGQPERIRNLHFSYVLLLRALRKASPFLYDYDIRTGNPVEDETAVVLLRRLLDSTILRSCQSAFTAFDESVMFTQDKDDVTNQLEPHSLQKSFKGVFHNISSVLDCVQCQQCKLHGKMAMLGYGTALKILFTNPDTFPQTLERNEIVAFINTVAKFSESIKEVRELTNLYWEEQEHAASPPGLAAIAPSSTPALGEGLDAVDVAIGTAAVLHQAGTITTDQEAWLVQRAMARDPDLLILAKHYSTEADKFWRFARMLLDGTVSTDDEKPDAIVVGSGLAGLAASLQLLDRGGRVVVLEKEHLSGGNSNKASSGINACCPSGTEYGDFIEAFYNDTLRSAGDAARPDLIQVLVDNSAKAVSWLKDRVGVDLSLMAQLQPA